MNRQFAGEEIKWLRNTDETLCLVRRLKQRAAWSRPADWQTSSTLAMTAVGQV